MASLMVPIDEDTNFADLASALSANLVLVIRPGLGTLNHTTLTLEAAFRRNLSGRRSSATHHP